MDMCKPMGRLYKKGVKQKMKCTLCASCYNAVLENDDLGGGLLKWWVEECDAIKVLTSEEANNFLGGKIIESCSCYNPIREDK